MLSANTLSVFGGTLQKVFIEYSLGIRTLGYYSTHQKANRHVRWGEDVCDSFILGLSSVV